MNFKLTNKERLQLKKVQKSLKDKKTAYKIKILMDHLENNIYSTSVEICNYVYKAFGYILNFLFSICIISSQ